MMEKRYVVSSSPHIRHGRTVRSMILTTIVAMAPAAVWACYQFGLRAFVLMEIGVVAAVATEVFINKLSGKPASIGNFHAVLVGLTLVFLLPVGAPWWLVLVGSVMAILVGKMVFGPLGGAPISPALVGLLIVAASWPVDINCYRAPRTAPEEMKAPQVATPESPQDAVKRDPSDIEDYDIADLFVGKQVGPMGTVSPLLLLLGGLFLIWLRVARWQAPLGYLLGIVLAAGIGHGIDPWGCAPVSFHLFTGAAIFGAFFLCTDWTSTPVTPVGMFLFGLIGGGLTVLLRMSDMPFGPVPWAIMLMSLATPLLDRIVQRPFGKAVSHAR